VVIGCTAKAGGGADERTAADRAAGKNTSAQIIIKFGDHVSDPSSGQYVNKLSAAAGAKLLYLRAMSSGAHVFHVREADEKTQLKDVITRLSRLPDVLYAEPDVKMRHQK
jgi:hypothetical protein